MRYKIIAPRGLRLREEPWGRVLDVIPVNTVVEYLNESDGKWRKVKYNGKIGWVHNDYIVPYGWEIGIDISRWNKIVSTPRLPDFVIIRSTAGADYVDPKFGEYITLFRRLYGYNRNNRVGVYHYFKWRHDGLEQFRNWFNVYYPDPREFVAIDVEPFPFNEKVEHKTAIRNLYLLLSNVFDFVGTRERVFIYTSAHAWNLVIGDLENLIDKIEEAFKLYNLLRDTQLWVAYYGKTEPKLPPIWNDWKIWQYTPKGIWRGFSGYVDMNYRKEG